MFKFAKESKTTKSKKGNPITGGSSLFGLPVLSPSPGSAIPTLGAQKPNPLASSPSLLGLPAVSPLLGSLPTHNPDVKTAVVQQFNPPVPGETSLSLFGNTVKIPLESSFVMPTADIAEAAGAISKGSGKSPAEATASVARVLSDDCTVYLVMRPVAKGQEKLLKTAYKQGSVIGDFQAAIGLIVLQHWAIQVGGKYYHLKRMEDNSLALSLTPFIPESIWMRIPMWQTSLGPDEILDLAVDVIAKMGKQQRDKVKVIRGGVEERAPPPKGNLYTEILNDFIRVDKGEYSLHSNNCWHFGSRLINQLMVPRGILDHAIWPTIAVLVGSKSGLEIMKAPVYNRIDFPSTHDVVMHYLKVAVEE